MSIAVLAWGSVVWDPRELAIDGAFVPNGPTLPLEFSRVSGDNRLTLVIDETFGALCTTFVTRSAVANLDDALADLWRREGSKGEDLPQKLRDHGRVGYVDIANRKQSAKATDRHPNAVRAIRAWASDGGYEGVIWTSLASNFQEKTGASFSVDMAIRHLEGLDEPDFARALRYVRSAPPQVQTPVRAAVSMRWPLTTI